MALDKETREKIAKALELVHEFVNSLPDDQFGDAVDYILGSALSNYLPASQFYQGIVAYAIEPKNLKPGDQAIVAISADVRAVVQTLIDHGVSDLSKMPATYSA